MKNRKTFILLRFIALILDISAIYSITVLIKFILFFFVFINFPIIFVIIFIFYFSFSYYYFQGYSPSKILLGINVIQNNSYKLSISTIVKREIIFKGLLGIIIPINIINFLPPLFTKFRLFFLYPNYCRTIVLYFSIIILSCIFILIFKKPWWDILSKTCVTKTNINKTSKRRTFIFFIVLYVLAIFVGFFPVIDLLKNDNKNFIINYPRTNQVEKYADFVRKKSINPVDYIYNLYNKYDIVILTERMHPEYTQYELFTKIIMDKRFIENVGTICTELGSVSYQDSLNNYLMQNFKTEDELNRRTAYLQRSCNAVWPVWDNTNLFDFFKSVNKLNSQLPDSTKINWYFTDLPVNWETATKKTFLQNFTNPKRDSIQALKVINVYNSLKETNKRKKILVIMNSYHAYGLLKNGQNYFNSTAGYLIKKFPNNVANILLNTYSNMNYIFLSEPVCNGKWDKVFSILNNPEAGFSFNESPFGEDIFDLRYSPDNNIKYKDIFTGFIYYKPFSDQYAKYDFPFEFENFESTILKRASCVDQEYVNTVQYSISTYKNQKNPVYTKSFKTLYLLSNAPQYIILILIFVIALPLVLIVFFKKES